MYHRVTPTIQQSCAPCMLAKTLLRATRGLASRGTAPNWQRQQQHHHHRHSSSMAATSQQAPITEHLLLAADEDRFDGIIIKPDQLPSNPETFKAALQESLKAWAAVGKHGIWLQVPREQSQLIPVAVEPGFTFHHAEQDYVMMTKWLPAGQANTLPPNASHQVGVGAIVVNPAGQLLVVQEANGPLRGSGFWKMPTGLVHAGEDLIDAVEREVLEETGVEVKFDCLIAVRQAHGFAFGKSDLFFCCGCRLVGQHTELKQCEREIAAVSWISFDEYMAQPFFAKLSQAYHTMLYSCRAWSQGNYAGLQGRVFEGTATRPRQDLLLWAAAAGADAAGTDAAGDGDGGDGGGAAVSAGGCGAGDGAGKL